MELNLFGGIYMVFWGQKNKKIHRTSPMALIAVGGVSCKKIYKIPNGSFNHWSGMLKEDLQKKHPQ